MSPPLEVLNHDVANNNLDIFATDPGLIGPHSIGLTYTLRDYPAIVYD